MRTGILKTCTYVVVIAALTLRSGALNPLRISNTLGVFDGYPEWVSARAAVEAGTLNEALLRPSAIKRLMELARKNPPTSTGSPACRVFMTWAPEHQKRRETLEQLVTNARSVASGRVVAVEDGFLRGSAGRMLLVSGPLLKGASSATSAYVFYPATTIQTREGAICARPIGEYDKPEVGDRIIAFAIARERVIEDVPLLEADPTHEFVHETRAGKLTLPAGLRRSESRITFDQLNVDVRQRAAAAREGER
jgi:hypothetical protein